MTYLDRIRKKNNYTLEEINEIARNIASPGISSPNKGFLGPYVSNGDKLMIKSLAGAMAGIVPGTLTGSVACGLAIVTAPVDWACALIGGFVGMGAGAATPLVRYYKNGDRKAVARLSRLKVAMSGLEKRKIGSLEREAQVLDGFLRQGTKSDAASSLASTSIVSDKNPLNPVTFTSNRANGTLTQQAY